MTEDPSLSGQTGVLRKTLANPWTIAGGIFPVLMLIVGLIAWVFPGLESASLEMDPTNRLAPPSSDHLLGTDQFGRDALARYVNVTRQYLLAALIAAIPSLALGMVLGRWRRKADGGAQSAGPITRLLSIGPLFGFVSGVLLPVGITVLFYALVGLGTWQVYLYILLIFLIPIAAIGYRLLKETSFSWGVATSVALLTFLATLAAVPIVEGSPPFGLIGFPPPRTGWNVLATMQYVQEGAWLAITAGTLLTLSLVSLLVLTIGLWRWWERVAHDSKN